MRPSSPRPARLRSEPLALGAVVALGLVVRLAFVALVDRGELGPNDQLWYDHMATRMADGHGYDIFGQPTLRWPPAYPFLISLVYRATRADVTMAFLLNAAISSAVVLLTHWCARPWIGRRAALAAALVVALLPGQWLFAGTLLTEPLAAAQILLVVGLVLRYPPGWKVAALLGVVIGFSALTRGEGAVLGLVVVVGWAARVPWRRIVAPVAVAGGVALAVIAPWVARNSAIAGEPTGVSLNIAETLYAGHNPTADGGATYASSEVLRETEAVPFGAEREIARAELLQRLALEWAREHPGEELALIPKKVLHLLEGDANVISIWIEGSGRDELGRARDVLVVAADITWYALLGAFVATLVIKRRVWREPWAMPMLVLPAASLVLYGIVLYGNFRYRVPYEPLMVLVVTGAWWGVRDAVEPRVDVGVTAPT
jgi:hypothetical protein